MPTMIETGKNTKQDNFMKPTFIFETSACKMAGNGLTVGEIKLPLKGCGTLQVRM